MKIHLPFKVLIAAFLAVASTSLVVAETDLISGEIKTIFGPDDLHLDPNSVIIAVDAYGNEDLLVNGVLFQTDKTDDDTVGLVEKDGVTVDLTSTNFIDGWAAPPTFTGGQGDSAANLSAIMEDIRWSAAPSPVTMDVSGLDPGGIYEVQILVNEGGDRDRHWDISVNDELAVDDFTSEGTNEGDDVWTGENSFVYTGGFTANNAGELHIIMQQHIGGQDQLGGDNNPILQALVIHSLKPREIFIDFNIDPEGTFEVVNNSGAPSEWRESGGVDDSGYFSVTDAFEGVNNVLLFDDITEGLALRGFDFTVDLRVGGGTPDPADGFSLNLVRPTDPLLEAPIGSGFAGTLDLGATEENLPEEGSQTGLGIGLDAWVSGGSDIIGISIRVDGILLDQVPTPTKNGEPGDETSLQTGPQNPDVDIDDVSSQVENLTWQQFRAFLDPETSEMTIQWKGKTLMDKQVIDWTPSSVRPIFAARTGGAWQNHHIDNLRLVMFPARLASLNARVRAKDLVITSNNGPESSFNPDSLVVMVDGAPVTATGVVDGNTTVYSYTPNPPFEPETSHPWTVIGEDNLGNAFSLAGSFEISPTNIFAGGFFTTHHVWMDGDTASLDTSEQALAGELDLLGDITVKHPFSHFHDNAAAPIDSGLSIPYPLWAEPEDISDENIIAGERIGGGTGDRNQFAIESKGEFFLRNGGKILFVVNSDDGFMLWIDGESVGEAGDRGRGNTVMPVDLEPGTHEMRLVQWENGGGAGTSLYISRAPDLADDVAVNADNFEILSGFNIHDVVTEDTDGDGLDDFKENFFFGDLTKDGSGDNDGDGLADGQELALRADPTVKDTDGDGLEDGNEVNDLGTSPSNIDSDGDSLADGDEVNNFQTDPAKADTDDDTFADNVELALGNDPNSAASKPDAIIAVANGLWSDPATWSDGQSPSAGKKYVAVGTVTKKMTTATGPFAGDSLTLIGPGMTLEVDHAGEALANLTLSNADLKVTASTGLAGTLDIRGDVTIAVGSNDLELGSTISGGGTLTIQGGSSDSAEGSVNLSGEGSTFGGALNIIGTDVAGLTESSLSTGSTLLASGGIAYGYDHSSDIALIKIQGSEFRIVLGGNVEVADIIGVDTDGNALFSLNDLAGPGPYSADDLLGAFQLDEGISGAGTVTLLGTAADTDGDGLRDSFEQDNFGNLDMDAAGDPDGDGLSNLAEQSGGTDPNVADVIVVEGPVGPQDVTSPSDAIVLVDGVNDDDANDGPPPGAEGVENVINNTAQKYLHFLDLGSGFVVTPAVGATTVTGIRLYTANDAVERDPASYVLEGSPTGPEGPWNRITGSDLALPDDRNDSALAIVPELPSQSIFFANESAYVSYRVTFPTLKDAAAANSMQIAEVELLGSTGGTLGTVRDLRDSLIAYYPFDGDLQDSAGDSHGIAVGADPIAFDSGAFGQGIDLNGVDQFVDTPAANEDQFDFSDDTGFSVSAWFRVDSFDKSWQALIAKGEGTNWRIHRQGDTNNLGPVAGAGDFVGNPVDVNDGELHHVVITNVPGESTNLYIDGELNESRDAGIPAGNGESMKIGENPEGLGRTWNGLIDDVALWSRPLSEGEILTIYNSPVSLGAIIDGGGGGGDPVTRPGDIGTVVKAAGTPVSFGFSDGVTFDVEYSEDLVNWTVIANGVTGTYEDPDAARNALDSGYYRGVTAQ
ncbi:MAG: hypothetical protein ACI9DF_001788 [Verrucomicrobiales bacterium]|jgi:hypothetical protein